MAYLDPTKNFGLTALASGIDGSQTSATVTDGTRLLDTGAAYNIVIWDSTQFANPASDPDREVCRVTTKSGNSISTMARGQEGTAAVPHNVAGHTYLVEICNTSKMMSDIDRRLDGNFSAFRAVLTTDQTVGAGATVTVHFSDVQFDERGEFDTLTTQWLFNPVKAGYYFLSVHLYVSWTDGETWTIKFVRGATSLARSRLVVKGANGMLSLTDMLYLNANDEVFVEVVGGSSGGTINGTSGTDEDRTAWVGASTAFGTVF